MYELRFQHLKANSNSSWCQMLLDITFVIHYRVTCVEYYIPYSSKLFSNMSSFVWTEQKVAMYIADEITAHTCHIAGHRAIWCALINNSTVSMTLGVEGQSGMWIWWTGLGNTTLPAWFQTSESPSTSRCASLCMWVRGSTVVAPVEGAVQHSGLWGPDKEGGCDITI